MLKTGGDYDLEYVRRLANAARRHLGEHQFVCLTDVPLGECDVDGVEFSSLRHDWPRWWSKLELFRITGKVLTLDLDTVLVSEPKGLLSTLSNLEPNESLMLQQFRRPLRFASGVMGWNGNHRFVLDEFEEFMKNARFVEEGRKRRLETKGASFSGDQDWIYAFWPSFGVDVKPLQKFQPGVLSYKNHLNGRELPEDASIVCFHGHPRPHESTQIAWVKEHWR